MVGRVYVHTYLIINQAIHLRFAHFSVCKMDKTHPSVAHFPGPEGSHARVFKEPTI